MAAGRLPLMAGNWKMNLNHLEAIAVVQKLAFALNDADHEACEVAVLPPYTDIRSVQTLVDRLKCNPVPIMLPIGAEEHYKGSIDLLTMKGYTYAGNMGQDVIEGEIPANLLEDAKKYRAELIERIVENDDAAMAKAHPTNTLISKRSARRPSNAATMAAMMAA